MSTQIKTHQIFARYHSNARTSFDIPSKVMLNTLRVANIQPKPDVTAKYQELVGMNGLIKNIVLYSQNSVLDQSRDAPEWLAFERLRSGNSRNVGISNPTTGTVWGFHEAEDIKTTTQIIPTINFTKTSSVVKPEKDGNSLVNAGTLVLQDCLKFLTSDAIVPGVHFPSLRLVIEWETDVTKAFGKTVPASWSMVEPILFIDEVITPKILSKVNSMRNYSIPFISMEKDRVVVPAAVAAQIKADSIKILGFKNKSVRRMVMVNVPNVDSPHLKKNCSSSQYKEKLNLRLNGKTYFPSTGIDTPAKKLDTLQQAWGVMNVYQGSQFLGLAQIHNNFLTGPTTILGSTYIDGKVTTFCCSVLIFVTRNAKKKHTKEVSSFTKC